MKQSRILLLDFSPAGGLGNALSRVLASTPDLAIQVQPGILSGESLSPRQDIAALIRDSDPKVVFLVLPRHLLKPSQPLLRSLKKANAALPLFIVTEAAEAEEIFVLLELGVADFITPPLRAFDILPRIWRFIEQTRQREMLVSALKEKLGLKQLIGESESFRAAVSQLPLIARCDASVMIYGETGTGKELFARAIHYLSPRQHQPFVPVNCGAIPLELVENELFGHERGAFTDAGKSQPGLIQEADGGSLFLDEVDELHRAAQVKLLRFLQDKEYRPLGSAKARAANVRLIAATNANLEVAVKSGKLRHDLYYRLNVIPLRLPPLRERREDIPALARHFLVRYATEFRRTVPDISTDALRTLRHYHWPGNVRELEHLIARATALSEKSVLESEDLSLPGQSTTADPASYREAKAQFERTYIEDLLQVHHGNISKAALAAHKNRRAFWELIRKYHIDVASFKVETDCRPTSG
jgi:two-component system response regulator GlrR